MGAVATVWLLQMVAAAVILFMDADRKSGQGDWKARLLRAARSRLIIGLAAGVVCFFLIGLATNNEDYAGALAAATSFKIQLAALILFFILRLFARIARGVAGSAPDFVFGSARFASLAEARADSLIGETGIRLGRWRYFTQEEFDRNGGRDERLHYAGEKHLLTIAPTRAGKGVSTIIPNLLTIPNSTIVIDPKGENAKITYERRQSMGRTLALDPWGITGFPVASFNPLDILTPDSPTLIEDALLIADALVIPEHGGNATFFSEQARSFITGFLLHIATSPAEAGQRHLGRLRDILSAAPDEFMNIGLAMAGSQHPGVVAAAARIISQNDEVRANILSTAQQNTHFLDSPALRASLSRSSFQFADLKGIDPVSLYIVLPVDRLGTYSRWLRLLIALAIAQLARTEAHSKRPVLFLLDEFAQLGHLQVVEDAYGLMAGMGLQLHAIVQDLSQLNRLYPNSWQTFLANSGCIQLFGTRDLHTAEYFSKMLGQTTAQVHSYSYNEGTSSGSSSSSGSGGQFSSGSNSGRSSGSTWSRAPTARPLLFPDELMRMDRDAQLLFIENSLPVLADKIAWHSDPALASLAHVRRLAAPENASSTEQPATSLGGFNGD